MQQDNSSFANRVAEKLVAHGVEACFGIPGGRLIALLDVLANHGIRFYSAHHEASSVAMAAGHTMATGNVAVVLTQGPGSLNALPGIASAYTDRVPLICLGVQSGREHYGRGAPQETTSGLDVADTARIFSGATVYAERPPTPTSALRSIDTAFRSAKTARRPAVVELYSDFFSVQDAPALCSGSVERSAAPVDLDGVNRVSVMLRESARPVLIVGEGFRHRSAGPLIERFCQTHRVPCLEVGNSRGVLPSTSPYLMGTLGRGARAEAVEYLASADFCLVVGAKLNFDVTLGFDSTLFSRVVQVGPFAEELGRGLATTYEIVSDEVAFLEASLKVDAGADRRQSLTRETVERRVSLGIPECAPHAARDLGALDTVVALRLFRKYLSDETKFVTDCGTTALAAKFWFPTEGYDSHFALYGLAAMGPGLPLALGVKLALKQTPLVAFLGDGAFLVHASDLQLADEYEIPLLVVVFNNGGYRCVADAQRVDTGRTLGTEFKRVDYVALAQSLGCAAYRASTTSELETFLRGYSPRKKGATLLELTLCEEETYDDYVALQLR